MEYIKLALIIITSLALVVLQVIMFAKALKASRKISREEAIKHSRCGPMGLPALINGMNTIVIEAGDNISINQDTPGKLIISATNGANRAEENN